MPITALDPFLCIDPFLSRSRNTRWSAKYYFTIAHAGKYVARHSKWKLRLYEFHQRIGEIGSWRWMSYPTKFLQSSSFRVPVAKFASEEQEGASGNSLLCKKSIYTVAFDPFDGSSIVDADFAIGSIFGIFPGKIFSEKPGEISLLLDIFCTEQNCFCRCNRTRCGIYRKRYWWICAFSKRNKTGKKPNFCSRKYSSHCRSPWIRKPSFRFCSFWRILAIFRRMVPDVSSHAHQRLWNLFVSFRYQTTNGKTSFALRMCAICISHQSLPEEKPLMKRETIFLIKLLAKYIKQILFWQDRQRQWSTLWGSSMLKKVNWGSVKKSMS